MTTPDPIPAIGVNGFGRIGECIVLPELTPGRALLRLSLTRTDIRIVAINHTALSLEHLLTAIRHDSTHGTTVHSLEVIPAPSDHPDLLPPSASNPHPSGLLYRGHLIHLFSQRDGPIDWKSAGAMYVMECTGKMTTREKAEVHITKGGAKRVIISAPSRDVPNVVFGVNHTTYDVTQDILSNASCTVSGASGQTLRTDQLPCADCAGPESRVWCGNGNDDDGARVDIQSESTRRIQHQGYPVG